MFKVLKKGCEPKRGTKFSAGIDLFASKDVVIGTGETAVVGLGVCIDVESLFNCLKKEDRDFQLDLFMSSHYLQLEIRSSLRAKGLSSGTGVIDLDFPKEIMIIIHNPLTWKTASNIAISWVNRCLKLLELKQFSSILIEREGFDSKGGFIIKKEDVENDIKASKIAQILLMEHKGYLMGIESDVVRVDGIGSTNE